MAEVRVEPLRSPRRFLDAQRAFYAGDPNYVPPLTAIDRVTVDPRRHPFFAHAEAEFFVARRNGSVAGRVSAFRDRVHDDFHGDRIGFFGHFEAADAEVTAALLERAAAWVRARGATALRGPVDGSTNYRCGLLVDGDRGVPYLSMPYNPPEYADWIEAAGFEKARDLLAFRVTESALDIDRTNRVVERLRRRTAVVLRPMRKAAFAADVEIVWRLYNRIWERNWGFVPMSAAEFAHEARNLRSVMRPELTVIAEQQGAPIAFAIAVPDVNHAIRACGGRLFPLGWLALWRGLRRIDRVRVLALGVIPEHRNSGVDAMMIHRIVSNGLELGFAESECGWVLEDNVAMIRPIEALGGEAYRRYRVYERPL